MTTKDYMRGVLRTEAIDYEAIRHRLSDNRTLRLLHAVIGIATESGELLTALKAHIFYGKPLDIVNLKEELGDKEWYTALAIDALLSDYEEIMTTNNAKLRKRYPNKFTEEAALNRDIPAELSVFDAQDYKTEITED
jgi:NTP pyrophosphatase (non-canonical NTP hydrolase)